MALKTGAAGFGASSASREEKVGPGRSMIRKVRVAAITVSKHMLNNGRTDRFIVRIYAKSVDRSRMEVV